jgi:hypothetical protein
MGKTAPLALVFWVIGWPLYTAAGPLEYQCMIKSVDDLGDNGMMQESALDRGLVGGKFTVTRATGYISGETLTTRMAKSTRVVSYGTAENSFKTVADFDDQIQVIEIQEFIEGDIKPFIALSMGGAGLITGVCR